jgi:hypothetical protein
LSMFTSDTFGAGALPFGDRVDHLKVLVPFDDEDFGRFRESQSTRRSPVPSRHAGAAAI